ncbi:MAG: PASTA domain-containing protein, partial [Dermatophilaceae bacterium]
DMVSIPSVTGLSLGDAMAAVAAAGFTPVVGNAVASSIPVGLVVGTQPAGRALRGSAVTIVTSTGVPPPPPPPTAPPPPPPTAPPTAPPPTATTGPGPNAVLPSCGPLVSKPCTKQGQ